MNHGGMAVALVGPTASGKSALAHQLALQSDGEIEILAVDAMTVYRGMDLGTAKPTQAQRREVGYHLALVKSAALPKQLDKGVDFVTADWVAERV